MALFTPANARLFAARAVEKRQKLALYRQSPPDASPVQPDQDARQTASDTLVLIRNITTTLRSEPEIAPDRLDLLTRSLERLWKIYAHAAQVPQPAHRKETRQSRSAQPIDLEPVSFAVLPEPSPATTSPADVPSVALSAPETTPPQPAGQDPEPIEQPTTLSPDEAARLLSP